MNAVRRFIRTRPRLSSAVVLGVGVATLIPEHTTMVTRVLAGWNVTVWWYLCLMGWLMAHASHCRVRTIAEKEHRGTVAVLAIMCAGAMASLAAIVLELSAIKSLSLSHKLQHYVLTGGTVLGSWALISVLFTFHYALVFYRAPADQRPLRFPDGEQDPNYWDFLYFSFTIAVAAQTSDVSVMTRSMRKTVLAQSVLSFLFNVAIIGLSINIAASLVGS